MDIQDQNGLYDSQYEHDACGVGFLANVNGEKSHSIVEQGIEILKNLLHRGATGADVNTGDGAGLLLQIPDVFFRKKATALRVELPEFGSYGIGMLFLPKKEASIDACEKITKKASESEGFIFLGWRDVPVNADALGNVARREQPVIKQFFVKPLADISIDELERKLYVLRKVIEKQVCNDVVTDKSFYICSLSSQTIIYKGLMLPTQIEAFYPDLIDNDFESAVAVVHQRYSTNTFPSWPLAQPFRYMAHNGEINTLRGNRNAMFSRGRNLESELFGNNIKKLLPLIEEGGSDSAALDNALELLVTGGRSIDHSMMMLIPQAWGIKYPMGPDLRGFFEYHAGLMEPWDGPAAVVFTDGRRVGAMLDRNGLRPARYTITNDDMIVLASEAGVLDIAPERVKRKGALRPGQMLLVDMERHHILSDFEIKIRLARKKPYRRWVEENHIMIHGLFDAVAPVVPDTETLQQRQALFGYTREDLATVLGPMASSGHEPIGSMGADQPLAVLSEKPQLLYWYFKQLFAQVTNPPIDPMREQLVMSLMTFMGTHDNILSEIPLHARLVKMHHPFLSNEDLVRIRNLNLDDFRCKELSLGFPLHGNGEDLKNALDVLCSESEKAVHAGYRFMVLSDRELLSGQVPVPALLAVAAVNRHLINKGLRTSVSILLETGEAREVMHMALLLGYGTSAINPYLAYESIADMALKNELPDKKGVAVAIENYVQALCKGLLKTMSKMGISTLRSYRSAQIFEAVGLNSTLVNDYFTGTATRIEGIGLDEIAKEVDLRCGNINNVNPLSPVLLPAGGQYSFRFGGERHLWTPETISLIQQATRNNDYSIYKRYAKLINDQSRHQSTLRGLFNFKKGTPISLDEVEPATEIVKRFVTGAMSFGSISRDAHETLAIAMNRLGGKSNSGEGGEDSARYLPLPNGDSKCSAIKQVASGRFGVTAEYLVNAKELQIKIAQGAKPGEGGQLPGHKVNEEIARVRHSTPGVTLISPPPHHDIYSIEDIAQLIFDLKNANQDARVSVKLVSQVGVGTVAAGVAKGKADMVLISGYDGGTGASPLSSIKHTGMPWELGLAETQQTLVLNGLRNRVRVQTDGQLKTGRDVTIAALLGAEEFGFATAPLVVCGCVMMRKCHKNTCPVGVATQDPELRKKYTGKPEYVEAFMLMIAEEMREYMAELGFKSVDDMVGRCDMLETNDAVEFWKAGGLDFSKIFAKPYGADADLRCTMTQDHDFDSSLDTEIMPQVTEAIETGKPVTVEKQIKNIHRTVGTIISSKIAIKYGNEGLPDDTVNLLFNGAAGQSFAAFCAKGMTITLVGEANDYVGKGLSGAKIIIKPYAEGSYVPEKNIIAGNVLLYGATSGEIYINGCAGERFAIRNSGAMAVVEGVGDHGCEYMTGGRVVVLGRTGVNFAAGMSGGIAYVYDATGDFDNNCNLGMVDLELVDSEFDKKELRKMLKLHVKYTDSKKAKKILRTWEDSLPRFIKVLPMEYRRYLGQMSREDEAIERDEIVQA
jgi:glutamate synthase (NADPH/NADH) large chain